MKKRERAKRERKLVKADLGRTNDAASFFPSLIISTAERINTTFSMTLLRPTDKEEKERKKKEREKERKKERKKKKWIMQQWLISLLFRFLLSSSFFLPSFFSSSAAASKMPNKERKKAGCLSCFLVAAKISISNFW